MKLPSLSHRPMMAEPAGKAPEAGATVLLILLCCGVVMLVPSCQKKPSAFERAQDAVLEGDLVTLKTMVTSNPSLVKQKSRWDGSTLLHVSCSRKGPNSNEIISYLVKVGADPNATDDLARTPLHNAYIFGLPPAIRTFLKAIGAQENRLDVYGKRPCDYEGGARTPSVPVPL